MVDLDVIVRQLVARGLDRCEGLAPDWRETLEDLYRAGYLTWPQYGDLRYAANMVEMKQVGYGG